DQDPEIGDGCFGPFTETLRNRRLVALVHGVELAALCRGACSYKPEPHAIQIETPHGFLNFVLLVVFELSGWDIEPCDANAGIETLEECIFELLLSGQSRQSFLHLSHLVDVERNHGHPIAYFRLHFVLLISVRQGTDKEAVAAGLSAVLGRKRVKGFRPGSRRTGPAQLFMGSSALSLLRCCPSFSFVRSEEH